MSPQFWLAVLAYLVPTFPLGYFWHLKTFKRTYDGLEIFRNDMIIPMGLGSMLLQAILFAWAFPHLMPTGSGEWARGALGFFMFFGLLSWSFMVLHRRTCIFRCYRSRDAQFQPCLPFPRAHGPNSGVIELPTVPSSHLSPSSRHWPTPSDSRQVPP